MLSLLTRLGLRLGAVLALSLDDIDCRAGTLVVRGKGNRVDSRHPAAQHRDATRIESAAEHAGLQRPTRRRRVREIQP